MALPPDPVALGALSEGEAVLEAPPPLGVPAAASEALGQSLLEEGEPVALRVTARREALGVPVAVPFALPTPPLLVVGRSRETEGCIDSAAVAVGT